MEVIYSAQRSGFIPGKVYRNPRYFESANADGVQRVVVVGDWPAVVESYEALGIEVVHSVVEPSRDASTDEGEDGFPSDVELRDAIKAATGKAPHWKVKRETLIEQYKALGDGADS